MTMEVQVLGRLVIASAFFVLGATLLSLRALGVHDFTRLSGKIENIGAGAERFLKNMLNRTIGPVLLGGVLIGVLLPTAWMVAISTGIQ